MKQLLPILLLTLTAILGRADEDKKPVELTPRFESEVGKTEIPTGELLTPAPVKELEGFFVPEVFSSDMVLQRDVSVPVWGMAATGAVVTVSFKDYELESTARDGTWRVVFPPMPASSEPQEMTISARLNSNVVTRRFTNVLVGDVWLASGQSNMEMRLAEVKGAKEAIALSTNPHLRFFRVDKRLAISDTPLGTTWKVAGPLMAPPMSAVGYHFVREIQQTQDIPIGLLQCAYGGTVTETWCGPNVFKQSYPDWERWSERVRSNPDFPARNTNASYLYNRMLKTVIPFPVRGFIWYQGSANAGRAEEQKKLFPAMVADWRKSWGDENLPFYIVQLPRYVAGNWHAFRCAQLDVWKNTPNTFMAVTIDLSKEPGNHPIHPKTKAPIGHRLALAARANVYGETDLVYSGPIISGMKLKSGAVVLSFDYIGSGLVASDSKPLRGFYISSDGKTFVQATAEIKRDSVIVSSPDVRNPIAVRYGAEADMDKENLDVNLANKEMLPASPFTVLSKQ